MNSSIGVPITITTELGPAIRPDALVILRSTVYPGTTDYGVGPAQHLRLAGEFQPPGLQHPRQKLVGALLDEGHLTPLDAGRLLGVEVVDSHPGARLRKGERERQAHVPAAPDHHQIEGSGPRARGSSGGEGHDAAMISTRWTSQ